MFVRYLLKDKINASDIFQLIHVDLGGHYIVSSISGTRYIFATVDDVSWATWTFLIKRF